MSESLAGDDTELRVLSFNCWGLKFVSKDRQQRFRAIADELAESPYDIIALQEVWVRADYELIRSRVSARLPYAKVFYAGALGAGIAILSRFPILETSSFSYTHNGSPIDVAAGDWIVGKGLFSAVISHPILDEVEIFNTHMNAGGGDSGTNEVARISRITAAWELTKRIRHSAALGRHVIVTGDFNSIPSSLVMFIIREHGLLVDAWATAHPRTRNLEEHEEIDSPQKAIDHYGVTADSPFNTYSASKTFEGIAGRWKGKRLDYILYRGPARFHRRWRRRGETTANPVDEIPILLCTSSKVAMMGKVPGYEMSLSDHFGVEATLFIQYPSANSVAPPPAAPTVWDTSAYASQQQHDIGTGDAFDIKISQQTVEAMLQAIAGAYRASRSRSQKHLTIFGTCVVVLCGLIVGSAWQPMPAVNPLLVLIAGACSWLGTTMLYSGFIWGRWELNWLMTVIEELELLNRGRVTVASRQSR
ncbi:inositol phosphophingolipids phospholipase C [Clavulina sp. PMI_390]|nr:inositol phosphophingolipids phospholipase C [Clavulina sp. PMI_390]